jgi:hypothetical protein
MDTRCARSLSRNIQVSKMSAGKKARHHVPGLQDVIPMLYGQYHRCWP